MTVYTSRIENCWSFFNFSFCCRDFNEVLLHKNYTKIIDKNRLKMDSLQRRFSWIFLMKTSPDLSCIWKPLKWAFQNWSYIPKKSIFQGSYGLLKSVHENRKFELFLNENTKISFSIGKFWTAITPLKDGLFGHVTPVLKSLFQGL